MKKSTTNFILVIIAIVILGVGGYFIFAKHWLENRYYGVQSFEDCAAAGLPIMESYPRQCQTPDGRLFIEQIKNELQPATDSKVTAEIIKQLFASKYPQNPGPITVTIEKEDLSHARGGISFGPPGTPGGIFFATKVDDSWQIVHDGNGMIPCELSKYGFQADWLADCASQ